MRQLIAKSPVMAPVIATIERAHVAWSEGSRLPVLLLGETGTGKTLVAQHIAQASGLTLISRNVATMSTELLRDCLFGHRRGAFTGASESRRGACMLADGGVLFLDEIGELDAEGQRLLLDVIETGRYLPIGEPRERSADIRWITATHCDLHALVRAGSFRSDLYERLAGLPVRIPPLRDRLDDIEALAVEIAATLPRPKTLGEGAAEALVGYHWPGNIRELVTVLESAAIGSDEICAGDVARILQSRRSLSRVGVDLDPRELDLVEWIGRRRVSRRQAQERLKLSQAPTIQILNRLSKAGVLRRVGRSKRTRYERIGAKND